MITYFDGQDFTEHKEPCTVGQITHAEYLWTRVAHEIPKHKRNALEMLFNGLANLTYEEAEQLITELYVYMPNEYPVNGTVQQQTKWFKKNIQ